MICARICTSARRTGRERTMLTSSRREFLTRSVSMLALTATGLASRTAVAAMGPDDKFDLVLRGGDVLDPSQNLRGRRDIGIRNAVIAAIEPQIPEPLAKQTLDVSGKLVFPGLVDFHAHVFYRTGIGLPADELVPYTSTTTYVSAGDAGVGSFSA